MRSPVVALYAASALALSITSGSADSPYPDFSKPIYTKLGVPGCVRENDLETLSALMRDQQIDAANQFMRENECAMIPTGQHVTLVTTDGLIDVYVKIAIVISNGGPIVLWSRGVWFRN
jgi:hypothetical protein